MSRLQQYLINEVFDTEVPITILRERSDWHEYSFTIDGILHKFEAILTGDSWEVLFGPAKKEGGVDISITGTGNQNQVFAAALKSLKMFTQKVKPDTFIFSAKEASRKKLYDRIAKLMQRFVKGYELVKNTGNKDGKKEYHFEQEGLSSKTSIEFSPKGNPVIRLGKYVISLVNTGKKALNKWNWVSVTSEGGKDMVPISMKGLKKNVMPIKLKNKTKKVFNKYEQEGYIDKTDLNSLYKDLSGLV